MTQRRELTAQELSYYKLLKALKAQPGGGEGQVGVVANLARYISSEVILRFIVKHEPWFDQWEIKEALLQNPLTPTAYRESITHLFAVLDLMSDMDRPGIPAEEKADIQTDIKGLIASLGEDERAKLKERLKRRASKKAGRPEGPQVAKTPVKVPAAVELPPGVEIVESGALPEGVDLEEDFEEVDLEDEFSMGDTLDSLPIPERLATAQTTDDRSALLHLVTQDDAEIAVAAIKNPNFHRDMVIEVVPRIMAAPVIKALLDNEATYKDFPLREALLKHPGLPQQARKRLESGDQLRALLEKVADQGMGFLKENSKDIGERIKAQGPVELQIIQQWGLKRHPLIIRVISAVLASGSSSQSAEDAVEEQVKEAEDFASMSDEKKIEMAQTVQDTETFSLLMVDTNPKVFEALLNNTYLPEKMVLSYLPRMDAFRLDMIEKTPRWWQSSAIRQAALYHPATPETAQLEVVRRLSSFEDLLKATTAATIQSVNVKSAANQRMLDLYRALTWDEKMAVIKRTGGRILNALWSEAFQDEKLMLSLIRDKFLNDRVIIKICRSPMAGRGILSEIGNKDVWTRNYQVKLALVQNLKTPHSVVNKLMQKLNPIDRNRIMKQRLKR